MSKRAAMSVRFDRGDLHPQLMKWRTVVAISKGQPICPSDRLADYWWQIESGAVRQVRLQRSGLRCIHEFFLPHEWFVCDVPSEDMIIEALCDGAVLGRYKRADLERRAEDDCAIEKMLNEARIRQAARAEQHILNLWHQRSVERVRVFLDQMSARQSTRSNGFIPLPMSRYDIADYLGLSVETVSRALTVLRTHRVIEFDGVRKLRIAHPPKGGPPRGREGGLGGLLQS